MLTVQERVKIPRMVRLTPCISRALALFLVVTFSAVEGSAVPDGRVAAVAQLISRRFGAGVEEKVTSPECLT